MSTVLEAIGNYLQAQGHGTQGTDIFLGRMPTSPDACIAVYEYGGAAPLFTFGSAATAVDRPSIQVMCRAARDDYPAARNKAKDIRSLLGAITNTTLSSIAILRVEPIGSVNPLGPDENDRPLVTVNFQVHVLP